MQRRASESFLTKPFFIVNVMRQTFLSIEFKFYKKYISDGTVPSTNNIVSSILI